MFTFLIFSLLQMVNPLESNSNCIVVHNINKVGSVYYTMVKINKNTYRFLIDTGCAYTNISKKVFKEQKLKVVQTINNTTYSVDIANPLTVFIGKREIKINEPEVDGENVVSIHSNNIYPIDGIIGLDMILSEPVIIDFKNNNFCFPNKKISDFSLFEMVPASYGSRINISVSFGLLKLDNFFIDTGSDNTSMPMPDFERVIAANRGGVRSREQQQNAKGVYSVDTYGPLKVGIGTYINDSIFVRGYNSNAGYKKMGMDFFSGKILGLDASSSVIYLKK